MGGFLKSDTSHMPYIGWYSSRSKDSLPLHLGACGGPRDRGLVKKKIKKKFRPKMYVLWVAKFNKVVSLAIQYV